MYVVSTLPATPMADPGRLLRCEISPLPFSKEVAKRSIWVKKLTERRFSPLNNVNVDISPSCMLTVWLDDVQAPLMGADLKNPCEPMRICMIPHEAHVEAAEAL